MRTVLGLLLLLIGMGIMLYGIGSSLRNLFVIYDNAVTSPLDDPIIRDEPTVAGGAAGETVGEKAIADRMFQGVWIGAIGIPPLLVGSVLLKSSLFAWIRRRMAARAGTL